jgi:hypothetical protein
VRVGREQRRHQRYDVDGVEGSLLLSHDARILNMSLTGLLVETSSVLRVGASYSLRVQQPQGELRFRADVQWCRFVGTRRTRDGQNEAVYQAGIDFRQSLDERAREILSFLEHNVTVELERRLAGRFRPTDPVPAEISGREPFEVCRLSLSGLLVETASPPAEGSELALELDTGAGKVEARGRVRNLEQRPLTAGTEPETARWLVGIELIDLTPTARQRLIDYIESLLV